MAEFWSDFAVRTVTLEAAQLYAFFALSRKYHLRNAKAENVYPKGGTSIRCNYRGDLRIRSVQGNVSDL